jgi:hypothetical protein
LGERRALGHGVRRAVVLVASLSVCALGQGQGSLRTLTGSVTDRQKEPLRGAIVQVQDESTNAVVSYITDAKGFFSFKRLSEQADYKVSATYRGKHSKSRELSHFDSSAHPEFHLVIELD